MSEVNKGGATIGGMFMCFFLLVAAMFFGKTFLKDVKFFPGRAVKFDSTQDSSGITTGARGEQAKNVSTEQDVLLSPVKPDTVKIKIIEKMSVQAMIKTLNATTNYSAAPDLRTRGRVYVSRKGRGVY